jgi:hypothetical protein
MEWSEVFSGVNIKIVVFWNVITCGFSIWLLTFRMNLLPLSLSVGSYERSNEIWWSEKWKKFPDHLIYYEGLYSLGLASCTL